MWAAKDGQMSSSKGSWKQSGEVYPIRRGEKIMRTGVWITEAIMIIGFLLMIGVVGSYSRGFIGGVTFAAGLSVTIGIILVGFIARKYITGRWR